MRRRRHLADPLWLAMAGATAYATFGLFRHWRFDSGAYDLGIFDQGIWHLSRFEVPSSTVRGVSNLLGDHFSPILALLAPLYWIYEGAEVLIVAQAILLAASVVPVWAYARRRLSRGPALALALAYALFWGMQRTAAFDFHEMAFAPLIVAAMILALDTGRWTLFWSMAAALLLTKEDLIPLLGGFGLLLAWQGRRRQATAAIGASAIAFAMVVWYGIPLMSDLQQFEYQSAYREVLQQPWRMPVVLVTPFLKVQTLLLLFAPFLFMPAMSPLVILIAPIAVERFLSSSPNHWGTVFHYWAPAAPIVAMAAADGLQRLNTMVSARWGARPGTFLLRAFVAASVVASAFLPGHQPLLQLLRPSHYQLTSVHRTGRQMIGLIPRDAAVVAQNQVVPHLSGYRQVFILDEKAPDVEYVIAAAPLDPWPLVSADELRTWIDARRARGYRTLAERDGWIVMRREP